MPFTPKTWQNDPGGNTPINAAELNRIETGISDLSTGVGFTSTFAEATRTSALALVGTTFTQITLPNEISDGGDNYDPATSIYTVPTSGIYLCLAQTRIGDNTGTDNASIGFGVHTSITDGTHFTWMMVPAVMRRVWTYRRMSYFAAGSQLRYFYYYSGPGAANIDLASLQVLRLA